MAPATAAARHARPSHEFPGDLVHGQDFAMSPVRVPALAGITPHAGARLW